jgi:signal transduction histidine kinase
MRGLPKGRQLPYRSSAFDVVVAVTLAVVGILDALRSGSWPQPYVASAALVAFSALCLAWRRRRPLLAYAGTMGALTVIALGLGHTEAGAAIIIGFIATYTVAAYGDNLAYAIAVGLIFAVSNSVGQAPEEAVWDAAFNVVALALPFVAGLTVRALGRRTATLETEQTVAAAKAAEEERRRIARELHDIISHGLGLVVLQAGVADQVLDRDPDRARQALAQIRQTGQEAIGELSTLVGLIRENPPTSADPQPTLADIERLVESTRAAGLDVQLQTLGPPRSLPAAVELNAYRVVQEGLTNALKHAGRAKVNVLLHYLPSDLEIEIVDDGHGAQRGGGGGYGLPGLRERVAVFSGSFEAGRQPEGGWRISASFPTTP